MKKNYWISSTIKRVPLKADRFFSPILLPELKRLIIFNAGKAQIHLLFMKAVQSFGRQCGSSFQNF